MVKQSIEDFKFYLCNAHQHPEHYTLWQQHGAKNIYTCRKKAQPNTPNAKTQIEEKHIQTTPQSFCACKLEGEKANMPVAPTLEREKKK